MRRTGLANERIRQSEVSGVRPSAPQCQRRDSNPDTVKYQILSLACLPVPPRWRSGEDTLADCPGEPWAARRAAGVGSLMTGKQMRRRAMFRAAPHSRPSSCD
jgi:hypothetical protein